MAKQPGLKAHREAVQAAAQAAQEPRPAATRKRTPSATRKKTPTLAPIESEQVDPGQRVGVSIRMDPHIHDELRRISYETRTSIQVLVMQGIEHVIGKHPPRRGA